MTCILALRENNKIIFGADSFLTLSDNVNLELHKTSSKLFSMKNNLYGFTGQRLIQNIFQDKFNDFEFDDTNDKLICFIFNELRLMQQAYNQLHNSNENTVILLSGGNHIIWMSTIGGWARINDKYCSIGSGSKIAIGAMSILEPMNFSSEEKVKKSIEAASKWDCTVGGSIEIKVI